MRSTFLQNCTRLSVALLLVFFAGCGGGDSAPKDESQSARQVAEDFLILAGPYLPTEKTDAFTSKKFQKGIMEISRTWYEFKAWSITSQSMNSYQTEATIRGTLQATKKCDGKRGAYSSTDFNDAMGFHMRLVKDDKKWFVDGIEFGAAPLGEEKKGER